MRLRLEEYTGADVSTRDVLRFEAPATDLAGVDLVLAHRPENWKGPAASLESAMQSAIESTGRVKPVLVIGERCELGEPFATAPPPQAGLGGVNAMLRGEGTRRAAPIDRKSTRLNSSH